MVKRPLLCAASAFITGIFICRQGLDIRVLLPAIGVFYIILISLFRFKIFSNKYDIFLIFLPLLLISGYRQMEKGMSACDAELLYDILEEAVIEGTVKRIQKSKWKDKIYLSNVMVISEPDIIICGDIVLSIDDYEGVQIGNTVRAYGKLSAFKRAVNPGQFDEYGYYKSSGICARINAGGITLLNADTAWFEVKLNSFRDKIIGIYFDIFPKKEAGIISAMILGEKAFMDEEIRDLYQENGISHILAVSGLHMSLIGMGIYGLLRRMRRSLILSSGLSSFIICCYAYMTGFGVSAERAVIMLMLSLAARLIGCTYDMISAVSLAALIVLYRRPLMLFQAGFLLSFGAVTAIAFIYPVLNGLFIREEKNRLYPLLSSFMMGLSVQIAAIPIVLYYFYVIPVYGIFLNLIILPLMSLTAGGAVIAGIAGNFFLPAGRLIGGGTYYILKVYELICVFAEKLPYHQAVLGKPEFLQVLFYYIILAVIVFLCKVLKRRGLVFLIALLLIPLKQPYPEGMEAVFLDVGQGDCIFIRNRNGTSFLFDGGSSDVMKVGKQRIMPFLLSYGIAKVDYVFLSHSDSDHINGIKELIECGMVSVLILPDIGSEDEKYSELEHMALQGGSRIVYFSNGSRFSEDEFIIDCLYPEKGMDGADTNAASMILEVSLGGFSMLLTGDAGTAGELNALQYRESVLRREGNFTLLKASHHGSDYSSGDEFLRTAKPLYTIISCGRFNSYGHPGKNALERLLAAGSRVYVTAECGAVMIETDGHEMYINVMAEQEIKK